MDETTVDLESTQPIPPPVPDYLVNTMDHGLIERVFGFSILCSMGLGGGDPRNYTGRIWSEQCQQRGRDRRRFR